MRGDAYRVLLRTTGRFDVIASEPSNPWMAGVEMLYSQEFLRAARDRLNPGGIYAQWFHGYETDRETISIVLRTYASVFDDVAIWYTLGPDMLLIGFAEGNPDPFPRLVARASSPPYRAGLARAGVEGLPALLVHELVPRGVLHHARKDGPVHTLLHPILSDRAARAFFAGGQAELPSFARLRDARASDQHSLLRRYVRENGGALTPQERALLTDQLCRSRLDECAVALASWLHDERGSPELRRRIGEVRKHFRTQGPPLSGPFLRQHLGILRSRGRRPAACHPGGRRAGTRSSSPGTTSPACPSSAGIWSGSSTAVRSTCRTPSAAWRSARRRNAGSAGSAESSTP